MPSTFVRQFYGLSFPEAVTMLLGGEQGEVYNSAELEKPEQRKPFVLSQAHTDMRRVFAYLIKQRCISRDVFVGVCQRKAVVLKMLNITTLYLSAWMKRALPVMLTKKSTATASGFRINVAGSNPAYSFHYISKNPHPQYLVLRLKRPSICCPTSACIRRTGKTSAMWRLNGVSEQPVLKLLELYPQLQRVTLCLDNDEAGLKAASRIYKTLQRQGCEDVRYDISAHKDWNEDLIAVCSQAQEKLAMVMR